MYLVDHPPAAHPQPVGLAALQFREVIVRRIGIRRHFSDLGHNPFFPFAGSLEMALSNDFVVTTACMLRLLL